jgi:hypothetical protein
VLTPSAVQRPKRCIAQVACEIEYDAVAGYHTARYTPMVTGVHALHITHVTHAWTDASDIRGSPYTVTVAPGPAFAKSSKCRYLKYYFSIELSIITHKCTSTAIDSAAVSVLRVRSCMRLQLQYCSFNNTHSGVFCTLIL